MNRSDLGNSSSFQGICAKLGWIWLGVEAENNFHQGKAKWVWERCLLCDYDLTE